MSGSGIYCNHGPAKLCAACELDLTRRERDTWRAAFEREVKARGELAMEATRLREALARLEAAGAGEVAHV